MIIHASVMEFDLQLVCMCFCLEVFVVMCCIKEPVFFSGLKSGLKKKKLFFFKELISASNTCLFLLLCRHGGKPLQQARPIKSS